MCDTGQGQGCNAPAEGEAGTGAGGPSPARQVPRDSSDPAGWGQGQARTAGYAPSGAYPGGHPGAHPGAYPGAPLPGYGPPPWGQPQSPDPWIPGFAPQAAPLAGQGPGAAPPWQAPYPAQPGVPPQGAAQAPWPGMTRIDPYAAQARAAAPPHYWAAYPPHAGMAGGSAPAQGASARPAAAGAGMSELMAELASGGNGLSSLGRMLNLDDKELWKGALIGAAAVLLLTNESVQGALLKTGVRARDTVKTGVDRVRESMGDGDAGTGTGAPGAERE